jgi:dTDP-4-dehydrorhamnose 3,5-epimerase
MPIKFIPTVLPDILLIQPPVYDDERGFTMETYQTQHFAAAGIAADFVQDNHSASRQGTLRGLHYQIQQAQGKLVRVVIGEIYDVAVDLRSSSPTFGRWVGANLSAENKLQMWLPTGFAHGFYVLSPWAEVLYKTTDYYAPEWGRTIQWDDPDLNIPWPRLPGVDVLLSAKDRPVAQGGQAVPFSAAEVYP